MIDILRNVERYCSLLLSSVFTVKHLELTFLSMLCRSYHYYSHLSLLSVFSMKVSNVMLNLWSSLCAMVVLSFKGEYSKYQLTGHCSVVKKKKRPLWYMSAAAGYHHLVQHEHNLITSSEQTEEVWTGFTVTQSTDINLMLWHMRLKSLFSSIPSNMQRSYSLDSQFGNVKLVTHSIFLQKMIPPWS